MRMFDVYLITNLLNGKRYVGITGEGAAKRWVRHQQKARSGLRRPLYAAMRKHGFDVFFVTTLRIHDTWEEACLSEKELIRDLGTRIETGDGYNITDGGEGTPGRTITDAEKRKAQETVEAWTPQFRDSVKKAQSEGQRRAHAQRSEKDEAGRRNKISQTRKKVLAGRSDEERRPTNQKLSVAARRAWTGMSPRQRSAWALARQETLRHRSEEKKMQISEGCRNCALRHHANMPQEKKRLRAERISQSNRNRQDLSRPCLVESAQYPSVAEASRQTKINRATLRRRLDSEKWPTYLYLNK